MLPRSLLPASPLRRLLAPGLLAAMIGGCGGRTGLDEQIVEAAAGGHGGSDGGSPPDPRMCPGGVRDLNNDPGACGRCDHGCDGGACRAGRCRPATLADKQVCIEQITLDGGFIYWTDGCATGRVLRLAKEGGAPLDLVPGGCAASPLALDATSVFYGTACGQLRVTPKIGAMPLELAAGAQPTSIAVDAARVYWTTSGGSGGGAIRASDKKGGGPRVLLGGQNSPSGLAADAGRLFWVNLGAGQLMSLTKEGSDPRTLAELPPGAAGSLALDDERVYVATGAAPGGACKSGAVLAVPKAGGPAATLVEHLPCCPSQLAADGSDVYFTCNGNDAMNVACVTGQRVGRVLRVSKKGGAAVALVSGLSCSHAIAVDERRVYFGTTYPDVFGDDRLMAVAK